MKPILSICIPTYNRPQALRMALDSIVNQLTTESLRQQVEIVVSDDAGSHETPSVVKPYQDKYQIVYKRNDPRLRFDLNYTQAVNLAHGKYCWVLGDDDAAVNGVILFMVGYLNQRDITVMRVADLPFYTEHELAEKLTLLETFTDKNVTIENSPEEAYLKTYLDGGTSSYIFPRGAWLNCVDSGKFTKEWLYYETILKLAAASKSKIFALLNKPAVILGQECAWARDGYELFIFFSWKSVWARMQEFGFNQRVYSRYSGKLPYFLLVVIARAKGHGLPYRWIDYKMIVKDLRKHPFVLVLATVIYILPNFLIRWARGFKKAIFPEFFVWIFGLFDQTRKPTEIKTN